MDQLGEGNFSKVMKCKDENTKMIYAMKIIKKNNKKFRFMENVYTKAIETELAVLKKMVFLKMS
jgi:serine/threonine protein kinase